MTEPALNPSDAPFVAGTIPSGWSVPLTQAKADAANLLYPVPPYGPTYNDPGPPPSPYPPPTQSALKFVRLTGIESDGNRSWGSLSPEDEAKLVGKDTIAVWPIAGRPGIFDDLPARAVRITDRETGRIKINVDTDGLNLTDLVLLGILYDPA
jgi:hypothetical protein